MASRMARALAALAAEPVPDGGIGGARGLLLAGAGHCTFDLGLAQRMRRTSVGGGGLAAEVANNDTRRPSARHVVTVLLNASPADTLAPRDDTLALRLGPELDAPPLADYLLYSRELVPQLASYTADRS